MAVTLSTAARNAACNAIVDLVDNATPGNIEFLDGATPIVEITCAGTAFGAASNGAAALAGTPLSAQAGDDSADPGIDTFNVRDGEDTTVFSGSCSGSGGGGDIEFDNPLVLTGQVVNLTSLTFTVPASAA